MGLQLVTWLLLLCAALLTAPSMVHSKTVQGQFISSQAHSTMGLYVASFCFHSGNGTIQYQLNASRPASASLYLFVDEDWGEAREAERCEAKLALARLSYNLTEQGSQEGSVSVHPFTRARLWHIVMADSHTCDMAHDPPDIQLSYELRLLNPDSLHNPTDHCSCEELGLLRFYQLVTLAYFLCGCIFSPRVWEALQKQGPMHILLQLLNIAMASQGLAVLFTTLTLRQYSMDGRGSPWLELFAQLLDACAQYVMLGLLLSLSLGRELAGVSLQLSHHLHRLRDKPTARVVAGLAVVHFVVLLWDHFIPTDLQYPLHSSAPALTLLIARALLAVATAARLQSFVAGERSVLKRHFYSSFTKACLLWFLAYPALVIISLMFSAYLRHKVVCMGVVLCQCVAGLLLYRLLISRSLYWEVSSLSSYLPLRMDKTFGAKLYS